MTFLTCCLIQFLKHSLKSPSKEENKGGKKKEKTKMHFLPFPKNESKEHQKWQNHENSSEWWANDRQEKHLPMIRSEI